MYVLHSPQLYLHLLAFHDKQKYLCVAGRDSNNCDLDFEYVVGLPIIHQLFQVNTEITFIFKFAFIVANTPIS